MDRIDIKIERDSVCMGDDCNAPHSYGFSLSNTATVEDLFRHLEKQNYLAGVSGANHSWEAKINEKTVAIFKGNNKQAEPSGNLDKKISVYAVNNNLYLKFHYYSATS